MDILPPGERMKAVGQIRFITLELTSPVDTTGSKVR
jgi:hypothetical protein